MVQSGVQTLKNKHYVLHLLRFNKESSGFGDGVPLMLSKIHWSSLMQAESNKNYHRIYVIEMITLIHTTIGS